MVHCITVLKVMKKESRIVMNMNSAGRIKIILLTSFHLMHFANIIVSISSQDVCWTWTFILWLIYYCKWQVIHMDMKVPIVETVNIYFGTKIPIKQENIATDWAAVNFFSTFQQLHLTQMNYMHPKSFHFTLN